MEKFELRRWLTLICVLLALCVLTGCESMGGKPNGYEYAWHAMNVVDAGQTIHIAREPTCYREVGFPTQALIGEHPSQSEVYLTMAAYGLFYHYTNRWLDNKVEAAPSGTQRQGNWVIARAVFNGAMILGKGATIMNNADIELSPWGRGCP